MLIKWSVRDRLFLVTIPELGHYLTDGRTYAEAATKGWGLMMALVAWEREDGNPLPKPDLFSYKDWFRDDED